jgi:hypothetical protein
MVTYAQANGTLTRVRSFYKNGIKSSNKAYTTDQKSLIPPVPTLQKHVTRNANIAISERALPGHRTAGAEKWTPYVAGGDLLHSGDTAGNCGEMACVALYVAISEQGVPRQEAFLWTLTAQQGWLPPVQGGFGHSVAFLGSINDVDNGWIVDPWCNLCKHPDDYRDTSLTARLIQWEGQGKRIRVPGLLGGWLNPTHAAITNILARDAGFSSCRADDVFPGF